MLVFGTRPEAIKMCPLIKELKRRDGVDVKVCVTGQHRQMLDSVLSTFGVIPDYDLSIMKEKQTLFDVTCGILSGLGEILEKEFPDIVLVHGDTTTTFASALACFYKRIPVGYVEAEISKLVGTDENNIYENCRILLTDKCEYEQMSKAANPYGDGNSSRKIADMILNS